MARWTIRILSGMAIAAVFCAPGSAASLATGCIRGKCFPIVCDDRGDNCTTSSGVPYRGDAHFPVAWQDTRFGETGLDSGNRFGTSNLDADNMQWGGLGFDLRTDSSYYRQPEVGGRW